MKAAEMKTSDVNRTTNSDLERRPAIATRAARRIIRAIAILLASAGLLFSMLAAGVMGSSSRDPSLPGQPASRTFVKAYGNVIQQVEYGLTPASVGVTSDGGYIALAHTDKQRAFELYAGHYLATTGQLYYSDAHQLADYEDGYHQALDIALGAPSRATEMISELYVPRDRLADFMGDVGEDFRRNHVDAIYGTIRRVLPDMGGLREMRGPVVPCGDNHAPLLSEPLLEHSDDAPIFTVEADDAWRSEPCDVLHAPVHRAVIEAEKSHSLLRKPA